MAFIKNNIVKKGGGGYGSEYLYLDTSTNKIMAYNTLLNDYVPIAPLASAPLKNIKLYDKGNLCSDITGGWTKPTNATYSTVAGFVNTPYLSWTAYGNTVNAYSETYSKASNTIDLTKYNELHAKMYLKSGLATGLIRILNSTGGTRLGETKSTQSKTEVEVVADISNITGECLIATTLNIGHELSDTLYVTEIWLV